MQLTLALCLLCLPLIRASEEEAIGNVHGDYGERIQDSRESRDKEDLLIGAESSRIERQIPLSSGIGIAPVLPLVPSPVPVVEQHIHHHHIDHVVTHEEEVPEIDVWDIRDSVPGTPNEDYPVLRSIPKTRFSCQDRIPGYYADADTKCQVFHRCSETDRKKMDSFLCLNGTTFNQEILSCDWWENVRCENAAKFYGLNKELNMRGENGKYIQLSAKREAGKEKPISQGIIPKEERTPLPPQFRSPLNRIQATESPLSDASEAEEVDEAELEDPPEISEVQLPHPTTTEEPLGDDEDEDIAYFFTPEQIKNIRASQDFGEKLTNPPKPTEASQKFTISTTSTVELRSFDSRNETKLVASTVPPNEITSRLPIYRSSRPKSKAERNFESNNNENQEGDDPFDRKLGEGKRRAKVNDLPKEPEYKKSPSPAKRKLRKVKKIKLRTQKEAPKDTAIVEVGLPFPAEQLIVSPNGTSKILKYKHLLHSDVTESFPPYLSGVRQPLHPLYSPQLPVQYPYATAPQIPGQYPYATAPQIPGQYPYATAPQIAGQYPYATAPQLSGQYPYATAPQVSGQYPYATAPQLSGQYAYPNVAQLPGQYPYSTAPIQHPYYPNQISPQTLTYEHHHHHPQGTHHRALEPHHVYPQVARPAESGKLLAPHEVIPALYHPDTFGASPKGSKSKPDGMHLVMPHHALLAHPISVNIGNRLAHHHHQIVPENPLAAHHYAAESHLAVAAFHHLAEPHLLPAALPAYANAYPAVYSHGTPQALLGNNQQFATQPNSISTQLQAPSDTVYSLKPSTEQYPLSDLLGMLN